MKKLRRPSPILRGLSVLIVALLGACTKVRELGPDDWGALRGSEDIVVVTAGGTRHDLESFRFLTTGLVGFSGREEILIPLDSIALVEVRETNTAAITLAVLAVGTAVGVLIASRQSDVKPEREPSCPFVYSFDGERYHFDSETFAGAIARGLDRTDYDVLEHLRPVDGRYVLRLTNERPETQYTDELRLLVVDHPAGTQALPDRRGVIHIVADAQPPNTARELSGADVLAQVQRPEGVAWVGSPLESADLDDPSELRDGLVLSFDRPTGASQVRLVVRGRNTGLAPFALRQFLGLQGDQLFPWYLRVAEDRSLRERIRAWVVREGMLHVSLWQGGEWVLHEVLPDVGPALDKGQVVAVDLGPYEGAAVLVKLESARGLWEIDWVAMDAGPERPVTITELQAFRAQDEGGRDIRDLLSSADHRYYGTVEGAVADIEFRVPEGAPSGWVRTVVLKSGGFYYMHVPHDGPGNPVLADRILDEPLVGNRYILERWRDRYSALSPRSEGGSQGREAAVAR